MRIGALLSGGVPNIPAAAKYIIHKFREGYFGFVRSYRSIIAYVSNISLILGKYCWSPSLLLRRSSAAHTTMIFDRTVADNYAFPCSSDIFFAIHKGKGGDRTLFAVVGLNEARLNIVQAELVLGNLKRLHLPLDCAIFYNQEYKCWQKRG